MRGARARAATRQRVLVVEDEDAIAGIAVAYLERGGFLVERVGDAASALASVKAGGYALCVLDLGLPDGDGLAICREARRLGETAILILTARDDDLDKLLGFEAGADDYLTKPFNPNELVARAKAMLRRSGASRETERTLLRCGELELDAAGRQVRIAGSELALTAKEFDLLFELVSHRGSVLTRADLLERVWGYTFAGDTRTVDVHVHQVRRKLAGCCPITTVWGVGYRVDDPGEGVPDEEASGEAVVEHGGAGDGGEACACRDAAACDRSSSTLASG